MSAFAGAGPDGPASREEQPVGAVATVAELLERRVPAPYRVLRYGEHEDQVADVYLPSNGERVATVLMLHGGFWRHAYDRQHTRPLAYALAGAGYLAVNLEYRRVGGAGGNPWTFDDIAQAVDSLPQILVRECVLRRVAPLIVAGHSAGGHLALWAAARHLLPPSSRWHSTAKLDGVLALAAVTSIADARAEMLGDGAASELLGAEGDVTETDPASLGATGVPTALVHGRQDDRVPFSYSASHYKLLVHAGTPARLLELPESGHFEVIDPLAPKWSIVLGGLEWLSRQSTP